MFEKVKNVVVILAHPDDETIGCGGTLHRLSQEKIKTACVFVSRGCERDGEGYVNTKRDQCMDALELCGIKDFHFGEFKDQHLDTYPIIQITKYIESLNLKPDMIITHHRSDLNRDHRVVYEAVMTAFRNSPATILSCEILGNTEKLYPDFNPNFYVNLIQKDIDAKRRMMEYYISECDTASSYSRTEDMFYCLARKRGSECNSYLAEAFMLMRGVI